MSAEATEDETIADLAMRATHWRSEAKRFAGQPEAVTLVSTTLSISRCWAEVLRLEQVWGLTGYGAKLLRSGKWLRHQ
jgi:hypothetical protein